MALDPPWTNCAQCGCVEGYSDSHVWEIDGVLATPHCPRRWVPATTNHWLDLFRLFEDGHLCISGGASDQPAIYIEAMKTIHFWREKFKKQLPSQTTETFLKAIFGKPKAKG